MKSDSANPGAASWGGGHRWGQVTRVCPGVWQMPQVRGFLAAGGSFSSAHRKKPHCWSLGFPHVWNVRPLLGPSFCTVRVTAASLQLHIVCPPAPPRPPAGGFGYPAETLGGACSGGPRPRGSPC
ncbi:hypothetical protein EYF80_034160 [Liparis tanakae]|uniref:Uncharacterized protein n=1 Tax=Liparis tanakae TaxID=230148 RepID=A0A4Z2GSQ4_9TELE|nr:hypothetical protein EYF80_034160 [Liparis tanakae]